MRQTDQITRALVSFLWADATDVESGKEWVVSLSPYDVTARVTYEGPDIWCAATRLNGQDRPALCMDTAPIPALLALCRELQA